MPKPRGYWNKERLYELNEMYANPLISVEEMAKYFDVTEAAIKAQAVRNYMQRGRLEGERKCARCNLILPLSEFQKSKYNCKECEHELRGYKRRYSPMTPKQKEMIIKACMDPSVRYKDLAELVGKNKNVIQLFISRERKKGKAIPYRSTKIKEV